jgi:D-serine deaminase-like pyridoxal phosphate-dependent protein
MNADLPTPRIVVDYDRMQRNLSRMAEYAAGHGIHLRPHIKTHKSKEIARMQLDAGASGLSAAKVGEAEQMVEVTNNLLLAYPAADPGRSARLAQLASNATIRVGIDSVAAAENLSHAAASARVRLGVLVDIDVGMRRTGVQSAGQSLRLAQEIDRRAHLRLDGIMFYPGHLKDPQVAHAQLGRIDSLLVEAIDLWRRHGLEAASVSGGSTPTACLSHCMSSLTEIRPGTYVFFDLNCVRGGYATIDDCAARVACTVVSDAVPGQVVMDAGSKTLTSDLCGPAPESGHGYVVEFPSAKITCLTEEHGQLDVTACNPAPKVGDRLTVIPNHICPCINLHDRVWLLREGKETAIRVDARGQVF